MGGLAQFKAVERYVGLSEILIPEVEFEESSRAVGEEEWRGGKRESDSFRRPSGRSEAEA